MKLVLDFIDHYHCPWTHHHQSLRIGLLFSCFFFPFCLRARLFLVIRLPIPLWLPLQLPPRLGRPQQQLLQQAALPLGERGRRLRIGQALSIFSFCQINYKFETRWSISRHSLFLKLTFSLINNSPVRFIGSFGRPSAEAGALIVPEDLLFVELYSNHLILLRLRYSFISKVVLPKSLRNAFLIV